MYNKFTIKSDVWSFGILLMEIFTYGQVPYPGMNTRDVIAALERGYRMPKPTTVPLPDEVYNIMMTCWEQMPERRPTFEFLLHFFEDFSVTSELAYREPEPF
jgi:tyrosine-protein kinase Src